MAHHSTSDAYLTLPLACHHWCVPTSDAHRDGDDAPQQGRVRFLTLTDPNGHHMSHMGRPSPVVTDTESTEACPVSYLDSTTKAHPVSYLDSTKACPVSYPDSAKERVPS